MTAGDNQIPFLDLTGVNREVADEVRTGWDEIVRTARFVGGAAVTRFEAEWAQYCGTEYAVGVANGTDALHLVLRGLGIGPGDEVVVPANTFVATVEAVVLAGAVPRFADVDERTLLVTADTLKAAVTPATKALIPVHLYGQMPDLTAIAALADDLGLMLVEDAAQAHGATWDGRRAGSFGRAACFSFYPGKNLGAFGDAGAVVTSDARLVELLLSMRDHGRAQNAVGGHFRHDVLGTNSRLDALQAVVLSAKLKRLDEWNASRRRLRAVYAERIDPAAATLVDELEGSAGSCHLAVVQVDDRDRVRADLAAEGIGTGIHYAAPCHLMAPYAEHATGELPVVEAAAGRLLSLPMFPHLGTQDAERVADRLNAVVARTSR
ncbi:DegT/DnrJ/EryC1/StrS family aminotransferase [Kribbella sp. NPDC059898]|uniref:DegT/DnrJ/EryC1/StrS family aminotransferase n=1 Tax=Kribbella sp. NPDC059898 TaxID=3346995 RepID=UPI003646C954